MNTDSTVGGTCEIVTALGGLLAISCGVAALATAGLDLVVAASVTPLAWRLCGGALIGTAIALGGVFAIYVRKHRENA